MIYLEDIIELIEDVPDELQRRGGLIQDWERQASEYKMAADKLTARLHNDTSLRDDEKANIYRQIGEMHDRARDVTEKKYEMANKCHQLLLALSERVSEWSFHCKLELEADAPNITAMIESSFLNETMMVQAAAANSARGAPSPASFRVPEEKPPRDRVGSSSMSRESTPMFPTGGGRVNYSKSRTRDSSLSSSRASSTAPSAYDTAVQQLQLQQAAQRKRKRDRQRERQQQLQAYEQSQAAAAAQHMQQQQQRQLLQPQSSRGSSRGGSETTAPPAGQTQMSSYMRKKKEREREERKLREAHRLASQQKQLRLLPPSAEAAAAAARYAARAAADGRGNVHANRERNIYSHTRTQQVHIKPEPIDDEYEQMAQPQPQVVRRAGPGRPPGSRTMNALLAQQQQQHHQQQALTGQLQPKREEPDMHMQQQPEQRREEERMDESIGGMSDEIDDDDLLKFLHEEVPGGMVEHDDLNLGLEDENLFDMASFGKDLGKALEKIQSERPPSPLSHNNYGTQNTSTKSSAAGPSRYQNMADPRLNPSKSDLKRQQAAMQAHQNSPQPSHQQLKFFGAGESLHGRQRKLTARAEIHAIDLDQKERKRRLKEEEMANGDYGRRESRDVSLVDESLGGGMEVAEEDSDMTPYCYCQQPSDGTMVGCEGRRCAYGGWFHLACLDMLAPPAVDKWYCVSCTAARERHRDRER